MNEDYTWNDLLVRSIVLNKQFKITEVKNVENIKSMLYEHEKYPQVKSLISERDFKTIQNVSQEDKIGFKEYLDIIKFTDQVGQNYIVTVYDNDALEQDPQIIEIFPLI